MHYSYGTKKKIYIYIYIFFNYNAQPIVVMHYSYGTKKYSFGSTIAVYILIFSGTKNNYVAI